MTTYASYVRYVHALVLQYRMVPYTKTSSYPPPAISSVWCRYTGGRDGPHLIFNLFNFRKMRHQ